MQDRNEQLDNLREVEAAVVEEIHREADAAALKRLYALLFEIHAAIQQVDSVVRVAVPSSH